MQVPRTSTSTLTSKGGVESAGGYEVHMYTVLKETTVVGSTRYLVPGTVSRTCSYAKYFRTPVRVRYW